MQHIIMAIIVTFWLSISFISMLVFTSMAIFKPKDMPRATPILLALLSLSLFVLAKGVQY